MPSAPILYVEDEEDDVFFMRKAFARANATHPLQVVRDGQEAIDYLSGVGPYADRERFPFPSLVLLDLNMPCVSGFEVLDWIRSQPALGSLPVIILSSSAQAHDLAVAKQRGANSYSVKPPSPSKLADFIREVESQWLSPQEAA